MARICGLGATELEAVVIGVPNAPNVGVFLVEEVGIF
jgi:hypothetical protein